MNLRELYPRVLPLKSNLSGNGNADKQLIVQTIGIKMNHVKHFKRSKQSAAFRKLFSPSHQIKASYVTGTKPFVQGYTWMIYKDKLQK